MDLRLHMYTHARLPVSRPAQTLSSHDPLSLTTLTCPIAATAPHCHASPPPASSSGREAITFPLPLLPAQPPRARPRRT